MIHDKRPFKADPIESQEALAHELTRTTWTLCAGFRLGNLLFLNDSCNEDSVAEYAVIQLPENTDALPNTSVVGKQIESITFGWCTEEEALGYIDELLPISPYDLLRGEPIAIHLHPPSGECCRFCE